MPKGQTEPPIAGPYVTSLSPAVLPPPMYGYRAIPGSIWIQDLATKWYEHHAYAVIGLYYALPMLAQSHATKVYFTDRESLQGLVEPAQFAARLSLSPFSHDLCQRYGVVVMGLLPNDNHDSALLHKNISAWHGTIEV